MTFNELLNELDQKSIKIVFNEGKLKYEGPEQNITPEIIAKLREYKDSLIRFFWPLECKNMMPINPLGSKIPFILVYFEVMNYPLSEYLGKDQPFYGFLHHGSRGEEIKYKSVESFAADYIIQLKKIIPNGPYFLGGFSFGGILAFEMAVQLQRAGHEVPFLAMLDTVTAESFRCPKRYGSIFLNIKKNILGPVYRKIELFIKWPICNVFFLFKKPVPIPLRNYYILNKYKMLISKYSQGKFNGELLLFRQEKYNYNCNHNEWEAHVDRVNTVTFTGDHLAIAREHRYAEMIGNEFMNHLIKVYKES